MCYMHYQMAEEHLYEVVDLIDTLQGLYDELKPETVELINRCACTIDVKKSMVMKNEPIVFWYVTPPW